MANASSMGAAFPRFASDGAVIGRTDAMTAFDPGRMRVPIRLSTLPHPELPRPLRVPILRCDETGVPPKGMCSLREPVRESP